MIGIFYKNLFHGRREMLPSFRTTTTTTAAEMIPHRWLWKEFWLREVGRHKRVLPGLCDLTSIMQAQTKKNFNCEAAGEKKALKKHTKRLRIVYKLSETTFLPFIIIVIIGLRFVIFHERPNVCGTENEIIFMCLAGTGQTKRVMK